MEMKSIYEGLDPEEQNIRYAFQFAILEYAIAKKNIEIDLLDNSIEIVYTDKEDEQSLVYINEIWHEMGAQAIKNIVEGDVKDEDLKKIQKYLNTNLVPLINKSYYNRLDIRKNQRMLKAMVWNMKIHNLPFEILILQMKQMLKDVILDLQKTQNNSLRKLLFIRLKNHGNIKML